MVPIQTASADAGRATQGGTMRRDETPATTASNNRDADPTPPNRPRSLSARRVYSLCLLFVFVLSSFFLPPVAAANPAANLDQCRNGTLASPTDPCVFQNGNLGSSNAHFFEGQSVPYRAILTNLDLGANSVLIGFDVKNGGKHALDYLTSYQRISEIANPCTGISPCVAAADVAGDDIPAPANATAAASFSALPASERRMQIYNGAITSIVYEAQGDLAASQSEARVRVHFTASSSTVVLAWGGHIASAAAWGTGNSATGISGSPYHMRVLELTGRTNLGNQDRSMNANTVQQTGTLTVIKLVENDAGGALAPADFTLHVKLSGVDVAGSPQAGSASGTMYTLSAGTYVVSEDAEAGYQGTITGDCDAAGTVTLTSGQSKTCTITNRDIAPTLTLVKFVTNDDGGSLNASAFTLRIDGNAVTQGQAVPVSAGPHTASEDAKPGYAASLWGGDCAADGTITLALDQDATCSVTNDDQAPSLTLVKIVVNDDGGSAEVEDATLRIDGQAVANGTPVFVTAGLHVASEDALAGYAAGDWGGDCNPNGTILLALDQDAVCTITNDDIAPTLTLVKNVTNDDGGSLDVSAFTLRIDGESVSNGSAVPLAAGAHQASEDEVFGYAASAWSGDCAADGSIDLALDQDAVCFITNDDVAPTLRLVKNITNDDGGDLTLAEVELFVDDEAVENDTAVAVTAGAHQASESPIPGYLASDWSGDCAADGSVSLAPGEQKVCYVTNDDVAPTLTLVKNVTNDDGGSLVPSDFLLRIDGSAVNQSQAVELVAGAHQASEDPVTGYAAGNWTGDCAADGSIVLSPGDEATCYITNDDVAPTLRLIKLIVNDDNGSLAIGSVVLRIDGQAVDNDTPVVLLAGPHVASEDSIAGYASSDWSGDCAANGSIVLAPGDEATCYLTNDDVAPKLRLVKNITNDDGGWLAIGDVVLRIDGQVVSNDTYVELDAGTHVASEDPVPGYNATTWSGDCQADGSIALAPGDEATCYITNDDVAPKLKVVKTIVNDDGGSLAIGDVVLRVDGQAVSNDTFIELQAGAHQASEDAIQGYNASVWAGDCAADGSIFLWPGDEATCSITNDDVAPTLTLIKVIVNDDGGWLEVADVTLRIDGQSVVNGTAQTLLAGPHQVSEDPVAGYAASSWVGDCAANGTIVLAPGDVATCTITNDDIAPRLRLVKNITNDDGGSLGLENVTLRIDGVPVDNATETELLAGAHVASEDAIAGYEASAWSGDCAADGSVFLWPGANATCYITNDDIAPTLTLIKTIVNDNGGWLTLENVTLRVDGQAVTNGTPTTLMAGAHVASEDAIQGYNASAWSGDCAADGSIVLVPGQNATCAITNDDIAPKLTLVKTIVNDDGGWLAIENVTLRIDGTAVANDTATTLLAGAHVASEDAIQGYNASAWGGDCAADGSIFLAPGDEATCTITNDDIAPKLTLVKTIVNDDGGWLAIENVTLRIDGTAVANGTATTLLAGAHVASEDAIQGYNASAWSGDCAADGSIFLAPGDDATCTITNDDIAPKLTLVKNITNDDGGWLAIENVTLRIDGTAVANASATILLAGAHVASEDAIQGYNASAWGGDCAADGSIFLAPGDDATCTITNDDIAPKLTLVKVVVNDDGGDLEVEDFALRIDGQAVSNGTATTLLAGAHSASEDGVPGYAAGNWTGACAADGFVFLVPGDDLVCSVVNDDIAPTLRLVKTVVNDDGGSLTVEDVTLRVDGQEVANGTPVTLLAGAHVASEDTVQGYNASAWGGDCAADGSITLALAQDATCTIVNDDLPAHLVVIKLVVNDRSGTKTAADFTLRVNATDADPAVFAGAAPPGVNVTLDAGQYSVSEDPVARYAPFFSADCSGVIANGETRTCIVTNDDDPATRTLGFWKTHYAFTLRVFHESLGSSLTVGTGAHTRTMDTDAELLGALWADVAKESDKTKRTSLEQARIQLLHQLVTAKLNCAAFGCDGFTLALIDAADAAYAGSDRAAMLSLAAQLDAYNNGCDDCPIPTSWGSTGKASAGQARKDADVAFWDAP